MGGVEVIAVIAIFIVIGFALRRFGNGQNRETDSSYANSHLAPTFYSGEQHDSGPAKDFSSGPSYDSSDVDSSGGFGDSGSDSGSSTSD